MQQIPLLSVSAFIAQTNSSLKQLKYKVIGEVYEITFPDSGHVYFTLKDKKENAVIKCVLWRSTYAMQGVQLKVGLEIILSGSLDIYAPYGRIQYIASSVELVGEGQLKAAYDALKKQLTTEGIFSPDRKRALPRFPKKIGIITSQNGAVIHDFSNNVGKYGFTFYLCDSRIEGKQSLVDLLSAVDTMAKKDIDLLVIMRGGGSLQSLAAFDTEVLVRALNSFPVPVVAAIGHHQDTPLAALASDVHVSTPTAAAMLLNKPWEDAVLQIHTLYAHIFTHYIEVVESTSQLLEKKKQTISETFDDLIQIFFKAQKKIEESIMRSLMTIPQHHLRLQSFEAEILGSFTRTLDNVRESTKFNATLTIFQTALVTKMTDITHHEEIITLRDPRRILQNGYSIIRRGKDLIKSTKDVSLGDSLEIMVADGEILSRVERIDKHE